MNRFSFIFKTEYTWLFMFLVLAICTNVASIFTTYAALCSGVGIGIIAFLLYKLWKMEKSESQIRSEFREILLTKLHS